MKRFVQKSGLRQQIFVRQDCHSGSHIAGVPPLHATAAFHFAKSRQDLGLGGRLASRFGPGSLCGRNHFVVNCRGNCRPEYQTWVATISNVTLPLYVVVNLNHKFMTILHLPDKSLTSLAQSICTSILFWNYGSVCDPEKNQVQNMGCEKQVQKPGSLLFKKRSGSLASPLIE